MNWKHIIMIALVAVVSGMLGGVIGSHVIWPGKVVAAEEFRLLDRDGYALATLAIEWVQKPALLTIDFLKFPKAFYPIVSLTSFDH